MRLASPTEGGVPGRRPRRARAGNDTHPVRYAPGVGKAKLSKRKEINKPTGHGHGEISENDPWEVPRDFPRGHGKAGDYVLGHIRCLKCLLASIRPCGPRRQEPCLNCTVSSSAFTIKRKQKCVLAARQISPMSDGDPLSLTLALFASSNSKNLQKLFLVKINDVQEVLTCRRKILFFAT